MAMKSTLGRPHAELATTATRGPQLRVAVQVVLGDLAGLVDRLRARSDSPSVALAFWALRGEPQWQARLPLEKLTTPRLLEVTRGLPAGEPPPELKHALLRACPADPRPAEDPLALWLVMVLTPRTFIPRLSS